MAGKSHHFGSTTKLPVVLSNTFIPRTADTKVPGRNTIVRTAIVFILSLSRRVSDAMFLDSSAMRLLIWLSFWAARLINLIEHPH